MNIIKNITSFCAAGALAACSSGSSAPPPPAPFVPAVEGSAENNAGVYSVTQNGVTTTMNGAPAVLDNGFVFWPSPRKGHVYESADVIALAGMDYTTNDTFAGISGTSAASIPGTGTAAYTGGWSGTYYRGGNINQPWLVSGTLTTNVDFGSGAVSATGTGSATSSLTINGSIVGTNFNGTALFDAPDLGGAATVPMTGGFYGTNTIAGIYQGDTVAGAIWGLTP